MDILGIPAGQLASITGNLIVGGYLGRKEWLERRARKRGLSANPARCSEHQTKIAVIENRLDHVEEDVGRIAEDVKEINRKMK